MILLGNGLLFIGLLVELVGAYFIGHEYLPRITFRDFVKELFVIWYYAIRGKKYPFHVYELAKGPVEEAEIVKGFFYISGGIFLQILGTFVHLLLYFFGGHATTDQAARLSEVPRNVSWFCNLLG
jgi:hypothetical protein